MRDKDISFIKENPNSTWASKETEKGKVDQWWLDKVDGAPFCSKDILGKLIKASRDSQGDKVKDLIKNGPTKTQSKKPKKKQ